MNSTLNEHARLFIQVIQALPAGPHNASTIPQFGYEVSQSALWIYAIRPEGMTLISARPVPTGWLINGRYDKEGIP